MGRSGRSGGGGGRSFSGGGGSRSFSGGMRSSSRSGSSSRSSSSRSSSSGLLFRSSGSGYRPSGGYRAPRGYGGGYYRGGGYYSSGGCLTAILKFVLAMVLIFTIFALVMSMSGTPDTRTTVEREPLPLSMSTEVEYYTDTLGWIKSPSRLESGMREFYKKTGVQPHLYIVDNINGSGNPTNSAVEPWMSEKYDEIFNDEAHLLMLFLDNGSDYGVWLMGGSETKTVIDGEAQDIIYNYIDRYYYSDMDDEDMFSTAFTKSAESIMTVYKSPWPKVVMVSVVIAAGVIVLIVVTNHKRKRAQQKIEEDKAAAEILNTPLDKIDGYDPADDLADKYK